MSFRFDRANKEIQRCISIIIQTKMNDPRIDPMLYVSDVNLTADFKYCKVKIALDSDDHNKLQNMLEILKKSEGFIKRELAEMVMKRKTLPLEDALYYIYSSRLYKALTDESTKLWYSSTLSLYEILEKEK